MRGCRELVVWQKAMDLVVQIYRITRTFPKSEVNGLAGQMQRASVSVPSNIAEGQALKQTQAYLRHLAIASGSLAELETQLEIAHRLGYLLPGDDTVFDLANEVGRMLSALRNSIRTARPPDPKS
jgi:four helix bundle protein